MKKLKPLIDDDGFMGRRVYNINGYMCWCVVMVVGDEVCRIIPGHKRTKDHSCRVDSSEQ